MIDWTPHPKRPQQPRKQPMQVMAFGLSRTSTMSLWVALRKLGYSTYHMAECSLESANDSLVNWDAAIQAKMYGKGKLWAGEDFEKMLWNYNAVADIPCILFVDELLTAYPTAKIIVTSRDVESWVKSVERSIYEVLSWKRWRLLELIDSQHIRHYIPILRNAVQMWTDGDWQDRQKLRKGFHQHYEHVRAVVPADKLLEFKPQDGWKPLCDFLGKPVPDEPYPHINEGDFVANIHYKLFWGRFNKVALHSVKLIVPIIVALGVAWYFRGYVQ